MALDGSPPLWLNGSLSLGVWMALPAYHFDVEQRGAQFVAVATELDAVEATGATYDAAIDALLTKVSALANQQRHAGEPLPEPLYRHVRPL